MHLAITIFSQWWRSKPQHEDAPVSAEPTATSALEQKTMVSARASKSRRKALRQASTFPQPEPPNFYLRRMLAAGVCAGLLPLIHAHTFLTVMAAAVCLALIFRSAW